MKYDIEADWKLLDSCNYRCGYCFFSPESLGAKIKGLPSASEWIDAFDGTGRTWLLHVTGGEPTLYPEFTRLCVGLSRNHYLSLNTNLSQRSIRSFAEQVDPARISLIHAAIHPEQRIRGQGWTVFLDNLEHLAKFQSAVMVSVVATPAVLADYDTIVRALEPSGFRPVPKMLRGPAEGGIYPDDYTDTERSIFRGAAAWARLGYDRLENDVSEQPTIWPLYDDELLAQKRRFVGHDCDAGHRFVAIQPDGAVHRCSAQTTLGNILSGDFAVQSGPARCHTTYCSYFCNKYSRRTYFDFGTVGALAGPALAQARS
ncbi:radical SAM protein [Sphingomonas sp.]|uniref:radical SAM protein n=1 Tax=Sphingomonas sp. TaxID=28214 RepID=UPI0025E029A1|nr:radical SAM protein [Sphingomonas sp.]